MGKLSYHFKYEDFACQCGTCTPEHRVHLGLVGGLEQLGGVLRKPVRVRVGFRCPQSNKHLGAHRKSYHTQGKAVHIAVDGIPLPAVFRACEQVVAFRGIGYHPEEACIHLDTRPEREVWVKENRQYLPLTPERRTKYQLDSL